jgi:hypothetical protein
VEVFLDLKQSISKKKKKKKLQTEVETRKCGTRERTWKISFLAAFGVIVVYPGMVPSLTTLT